MMFKKKILIKINYRFNKDNKSKKNKRINKIRLLIMKIIIKIKI